MRFNTKAQSFPGLLYASALGFKAREFFAADAEAHVVPQVDLTSQ